MAWSLHCLLPALFTTILYTVIIHIIPVRCALSCLWLVHSSGRMITTKNSKAWTALGNLQFTCWTFHGNWNLSFCGNWNLYLYFLQFLCIAMVLVIEILPHGRQGPTYLTYLRARRFPLPDGPGQVKLPVGQVDLDRFFFFFFHISRSKNFKVLGVGQVMILRKGEPCT